MRLLIFIIATLSISCNSDKTDTKTMFTYDIQYGGDPHEKYDLKGQTSYSNFISAFESFPCLTKLIKPMQTRKVLHQHSLLKINLTKEIMGFHVRRQSKSWIFSWLRLPKDKKGTFRLWQRENGQVG
jgi:hypothetical protein